MDNDVVAQFTEITSSTPELAIQYLQITEFQIEQAMQLYFENGGAPLTAEPSQPATQSGFSGSGQEVVNIDSDSDDETTSANRAHDPTMPASGGTFDDDEAMARRLQQEMYGGGQDNEDEVRAPMARTTETLVGPGADFGSGEDMHADILSQLRARQRGGRCFWCT
jgi:hypothetical protein